VSGRLDRQSVSEEGDVPHDVTRVEEIPFVFSIMELLPMCQQTEIILPTYHVSSIPSYHVSRGKYPHLPRV